MFTRHRDDGQATELLGAFDGESAQKACEWPLWVVSERPRTAIESRVAPWAVTLVAEGVR